MDTLKSVNEHLRKTYGEIQEGLPCFRVVHGSDQFEKRKEYIDGEYTGHVITVPKYPSYQDAFILEKFIGFPKEFDELCEAKFSYEPIWTFYDKQGKPQPLVLSMVNFLVYTLLYVQTGTSPANASEEEMKKYAKEVEDGIAFLENESPDMAGALHDGEAISMAGLEIPR